MLQIFALLLSFGQTWQNIEGEQPFLAPDEQLSPVLAPENYHDLLRTLPHRQKIHRISEIPRPNTKWNPYCIQAFMLPDISFLHHQVKNYEFEEEKQKQKLIK